MSAPGWKDSLRGVAEAQAKASAEATAAKAPLIEIFASIQGEGRFVGVPMVFVRTATCPLRCLYCDTPNSYQAPQRFPVRLGARDAQEPNPVTGERAAELVRQVWVANPVGQKPRVSLTGGEPLVFPDFVRSFGKAIRDKGARLHLETAAVDPDSLAKCIEQVDHLSADYKLPETLGTPAGGPPPAKDGGYAAQHLKCCEIAIRRGASVDVKIVLTDKVLDPSLEQALEVLSPLREKILLVLQPVTPFGAATGRLPRAALERHTATAVRKGFDVRVLPQVHKTLAVP